MEIARLFGFVLSKDKKPNEVLNQETFVAPPNDDGATNVLSTPHSYSGILDLNASTKNEIELITRYREMAMQPELESAINDIVDEAIAQDDDGKTINLIMDDLKLSQSIKTKIQDEFNIILRLLNYNNMAADIFRRWYVDGRLFYHVILDRNVPQEGIKELRYIDPRKIKKIRELKKTKDPKTGIEIITVENEYYVYNESMQSSVSGTYNNQNAGIKITVDSIINVNSGLMDARRATVLSYLHKAIKPLNQLRIMEDATVIYRISRAPERRVFKIDVGGLPKQKGEQYLNDIMAKYKNKVVYDIQTGQVRDDRKHMSIMEDIWVPTRGDKAGTVIDTLPGGENLGVMEDVEYFQKNLYKSLGIPVTRLDPQDGFNIGRSTEMTRDELKFQKFVERLQNTFSDLFDQLMKLQLSLKGIMSPDDWDNCKEYVYFDFIKDNYFTELKKAEMMRERLSILSLIDPYTGVYYSKGYIRRNVLHLTDDEIKEIEKEIEQEAKEQEAKGLPPQIGGVLATANMQQQLAMQELMPQQPAPGQPGQSTGGNQQSQKKPVASATSNTKSPTKKKSVAKPKPKEKSNPSQQDIIAKMNNN